MTNLLNILKSQQRFIDKAIGKMQKAAAKMERKLFALYVADIVGRLKVNKNGEITQAASNYNLIPTANKLFERFIEAEQVPVLRQYIKDLTELSAYTSEYYRAMGFNAATVKGILEQFDTIEKGLGITKRGKILPGGYLSRLQASAPIKDKIASYVNQSITTGVTLQGFTEGLRNVVTGGKNEGIFQANYRQFAYDTFNQVTELNNAFTAKRLGLEWFIYQGSLIKTSRKFCEKRAGKVFHVSEVDDWKNDPDLIDKKTKDTYKPLIERGRFNCRHWIRYISEPMAKRRDPAKYRQIRGNA